MGRRRPRSSDEYRDEADEPLADSPLSTATLTRQVRRAGRRWGLVPVVRNGRVRVAEVVRGLEGGAGICEMVSEPRHELCTVDDEHPFTAALFNRIGNGEVDVAARARRFDELARKVEKAKAEEIAHEMREQWNSRRRITFLPGGLWTPAGLTNRRGRR